MIANPDIELQLNESLLALSDLLQRREAWRRLRAHIEQYADHPNYPYWIAFMDRRATALNQMIESATYCLLLGV